MEEAVQRYCHGALADSTRRTYQAAITRFTSFCTMFHVVDPFPVSEYILSCFSAYLADQGLAHQSIRTYLAGIRNFQLLLGLPDPRDHSTLPRLRLLLAGVRRTWSQTHTQARRRLPITSTILSAIFALWESSG